MNREGSSRFVYFWRVNAGFFVGLLAGVVIGLAIYHNLPREDAPASSPVAMREEPLRLIFYSAPAPRECAREYERYEAALANGSGHLATQSERIHQAEHIVRRVCGDQWAEAYIC